MIVVNRDVTQKSQSGVMDAAELPIISVAHQARNPLFCISSTLDVLEVNFGNREEYREYFAMLRKQVHRLNTLMEGILDYGKPPVQELSREVVEGIIEQAIQLCLPLAEQLSVNIVSHVWKETSPILVDRGQLTQAFINLIENAVQHSPPGGTVVVEVKETHIEEQIRIECNIKDNGPGFPAENLSRIFEPFYTQRRGGTGLGLPIAKRIVNGHGGKIRAGNRPEGGAILRVIFRPVATVRQYERRRGGCAG